MVSFLHCFRCVMSINHLLEALLAREFIKPAWHHFKFIAHNTHPVVYLGLKIDGIVKNLCKIFPPQLIARINWQNLQTTASLNFMNIRYTLEINLRHFIICLDRHQHLTNVLHLTPFSLLSLLILKVTINSLLKTIKPHHTHKIL